mmetsp:Transcript_28432/g.80314  ORF Transcript_28432/g.80314 Transcript_28432/m.80314 type:complete len:236 (+) Transcript_28432:351-1058(+)
MFQESMCTSVGPSGNSACRSGSMNHCSHARFLLSSSCSYRSFVGSSSKARAHCSRPLCEASNPNLEMTGIWKSMQTVFRHSSRSTMLSAARQPRCSLRWNCSVLYSEFRLSKSSCQSAQLRIGKSACAGAPVACACDSGGTSGGSVDSSVSSSSKSNAGLTPRGVSGDSALAATGDLLSRISSRRGSGAMDDAGMPTGPTAGMKSARASLHVASMSIVTLLGSALDPMLHGGCMD